MTTFTVTTLADSGAGSLREAVGLSNANGAGADTIFFQSGLTGTIQLSGGVLTITGSLDIVGSGADTITLEGAGGAGDRIFMVDDGDGFAVQTVGISGLTLTKGTATGAGSGGAVYNREILTLDGLAVTNSKAGANGGGVFSEFQTLTVKNSTFSDNQAAGSGGGLAATSLASVANSTFYANKATSNGGGAAFSAGVVITSSTFVSNQATASGGALLVANVAGTITNSIVTGNTGATNSAIGSTGGVTATYSLVSGTTTGVTFSGAGNITGATADAYVPGAATLVKGRGVFVPADGSAAVNAGDTAYTTSTNPTLDERGYVRVVGGRIDMGAVESGSAPPTTYSIANATAGEGDVTKTLDFTVTRNDTTVAATVDFTTADGSAKAGSDYVAKSGTASFAIGAATATVSITINGDVVPEADETFTVTLSNPSGGGSLGTATATGTLTNDDYGQPPSNTPGAGGATTGGTMGGSSAPPLTAAAETLAGLNFSQIARFQTYNSAPLPATVTTPDGRVLPNPLLEQQKAVADLAAKVSAGTLTLGQAQDIIVDLADGTTSVATMSYQFFTGKLPTAAGLDYLVSSPQNPGDLNDGYYAGMSLENRYINFAVNLGKIGEGRATFQANYGALSLSDATAKAYLEIFGKAADASKLAAILTPERSAYLLSLGGDSLGQKAAMVGFLLGEAAKADLGPYAARNENFLYDLLDGTAAFGADAHVYDTAGPITVGLVGAGA